MIPQQSISVKLKTKPSRTSPPFEVVAHYHLRSLLQERINTLWRSSHHPTILCRNKYSYRHLNRHPPPRVHVQMLSVSRYVRSCVLYKIINVLVLLHKQIDHDFHVQPERGELLKQRVSTTQLSLQSSTGSDPCAFLFVVDVVLPLLLCRISSIILGRKHTIALVTSSLSASTSLPPPLHVVTIDLQTWVSFSSYLNRPEQQHTMSSKLSVLTLSSSFRDHGFESSIKGSTEVEGFVFPSRTFLRNSLQDRSIFRSS